MDLLAIGFAVTILPKYGMRWCVQPRFPTPFEGIFFIEYLEGMAIQWVSDIEDSFGTANPNNRSNINDETEPSLWTTCPCYYRDPR